MRTQPRPPNRRRGTTLVECALIYPLTMLLVAGMISGAVAAFRYQQVATLAREAARWAAVHGPTFQSEQGGSVPTQADVMTNVLNARLVGIRPADLTCQISYPASTNTVVVTLSYRWSAGFLPGTITMRSTAVSPITY